MKFLFGFISLFMLQAAQADSVLTQIPTFSGSAVIISEGLSIQNVELGITNQFCSAASCFSTISFNKTLPSSLQISRDAQSVQFMSSQSNELKSSKFLSSFSACYVMIKITARTTDGKEISGQAALAESRNAQVCNDEKALGEEISAKLQKPLTVQAWSSQSLIIQ